MTFMTFVIAMAAIGVFYLYSTRPACKQVMDNLSVTVCEALQAKVASSSGQIIRLKEVPHQELLPDSLGNSGSAGNQLTTGTPDDEKTAIAPEPRTRSGITSSSSLEEGQQLHKGTSTTSGSQEKGSAKGEKKKKKKRSKSKGSKRKKSTKGKKKEGKAALDDTVPDDI